MVFLGLLLGETRNRREQGKQTEQKTRMAYHPMTVKPHGSPFLKVG